MALKTSNVVARVEPDIKEKAEAILAQLGISVSSGINMFYRQIVLMNGLPFRPMIPIATPKALEEMTEAEFDAKLSRAMAQAQAGQGVDAEVFFERLKQEVLNTHVE